jgi:hypothetical protein
VGYEDVWKTTNRGDSWTKISSLNLTNKIRSMAIAPSDNKTIYITDFDNLYKTTNGGTSWTNLTSSLPSTSNSINYISVDANNPSKLWIALGGYDNLKVFESANGGTVWSNISDGLPSVPANTIIENKLSGSQQLYVGTDIGVFFKDGDSDWELFSADLPSVIVTELEIYYDETTPENNTLYASTYGRGLWKSTLASYDTESASGTEKLEEFGVKIFPNPSNGKVNVEINRDYNSANISVLDLSGKIIYSKTLSNNNSKEIDLSTYAKGMYIIQLDVDNEKIVTKLIIE